MTEKVGSPALSAEPAPEEQWTTLMEWWWFVREYLLSCAPEAYPGLLAGKAIGFEAAPTFRSPLGGAYSIVLDEARARSRAYQSAYRLQCALANWPGTPKPTTKVCKLTGRVYRWGYE